ncbi:unnamed protein product [Brassica oleracea var. botrytis]
MVLSYMQGRDPAFSEYMSAKSPTKPAPSMPAITNYLTLLDFVL